MPPSPHSPAGTGTDPDSDSNPQPPNAPSPRMPGTSEPRLDALPHELLSLVLTHLSDLCRHPRDRHWTLTQMLCTNKVLYAHTKPHVWQSVSSSLWADCATGMWMCANDRARHLCRQRDPAYAQLTDVLTFPLCDRYRTVDPAHLRYTTSYAFIFECACEVLGEHWHLGGPQPSSSSTSSMSSGSSDSDSHSYSHSDSNSDFDSDSDSESRPGPSTREAPANTTFLAPVTRRRKHGRRRHRVPNAISASSPASSSSSGSDGPSPTPVHATLLSPTFHSRLAHLTLLRRLTVSSSSNVLDARSMSVVGHALCSALLASGCRLTYLSIDISSHPGAFLTHLVSLATPTLRHLTLRFVDASNSDQPRANAAAAHMLRRAVHLESLVLCGRTITVGLLSTIAACAHLGTLELHGEIVDEAGQRDYLSEFWPAAGTPDLIPAPAPSSSTSTAPPRSIHTLRLYLTGGHEPLLATIYPRLHRPLTSLEWPVALASRVYASLVLNTQSFTLQCPHQSMYLHAILTDAASSRVLTHLHLRGYAGALPRQPLPYLHLLEVVDSPPEAVVALVTSGAVPNLGALVVRTSAAKTSDGPLAAVWTPLALLDPAVCWTLGLPADAVVPRGLASVHVEAALAPGTALERVRSAIGFRPDARVPYVTGRDGLALGDFVHLLACEPATADRVRFPWAAPADAGGVSAAARQVLVHVTYREAPSWTRDASVTVVLHVRRCF